MNRIPIVAVMAILSACSTEKTDEAVVVTDSNVVRVGVYRDGRITLDGRDASLQEVREAFAGLAENEGGVWYYREGADSEPHPNAMLVVEAIVEAQLPVSMSTKPDFSDVVMPDGSTKAR